MTRQDVPGGDDLHEENKILSLAELARKYNVSAGLIRRKIVKAGHEPQKKLPDQETLIGLRKDGLLMTEIAEMYGCTRQAVSSALKNIDDPLRGILPRPAWNKLPNCPDLIALYKTMSSSKIGKRYGVENTTVVRKLHACGQSTKKEDTGRGRKLPDTEILLDIYQSGKSVTEIAGEFNVVPQTVMIALKKHPDYSARGNRKILVEPQEIAGLHEEGMSTCDLARIYGVTRETINRYIRLAKEQRP